MRSSLILGKVDHAHCEISVFKIDRLTLSMRSCLTASCRNSNIFIVMSRHFSQIFFDTISHSNICNTNFQFKTGRTFIIYERRLISIYEKAAAIYDKMAENLLQFL